MSQLPRTDDLPRAQDGFDPGRVEEAFADFGDRVRELEELAAELRAELRALRESRPVAYDDEEWPEDAYDGPPADWVAAIPPPFDRALAWPRVIAEVAFLLLVALLAGLADLSAPWIALLMGGAWALVAASEWTAATKRARWRLEEIPTAAAGEDAGESTGPWAMPVVEATVVEPADGSDAHTAIASLPAAAPAAAVVEAEPAAEPEVDAPPEEPPAEESQAAAADEPEAGEVESEPAPEQQPEPAADVAEPEPTDVPEPEPTPESTPAEPPAELPADEEPEADEAIELPAAEPDVETAAETTDEQTAPDETTDENAAAGTAAAEDESVADDEEPGADADEAEPEPEPPRRFGLFRRRRPPEPAETQAVEDDTAA